MSTPIDALSLYTKLFTGLILLLNISLLVSIRFALKWARKTSQIDTSDEGARNWASARRVLAMLIFVVIGMNAGAVFANLRLVKATKDLAQDHPELNSEIVLSRR